MKKRLTGLLEWVQSWSCSLARAGTCGPFALIFLGDKIWYAGSGIKPTDLLVLQMIQDDCNHPTKPLTLSVIVFDANIYGKNVIFS